MFCLSSLIHFDRIGEQPCAEHHLMDYKLYAVCKSVRDQAVFTEKRFQRSTKFSNSLFSNAVLIHSFL